MERLLPVVLLALLSIPSSIFAVVHHVPSQFPTIRAGIDAAKAGDIVLVACGTYHEHDLALKSGVHLRGETGRADCVTIDADSLGWVFYCNGVDETAIVEGLTISGGWEIYGGGMYCKDYSSPRFLNCTFVGNAASYGGAVYCRNHSSPTFTDCVFSNNAGACGGGVLCYYYYSSPTLENCTFISSPKNHDPDSRYSRSYSSAMNDDAIIAVGPTGEAVHGKVGGGEGFTCCDIYDDESGDWLGCIEATFETEGAAEATTFACSPDSESYSFSAPSFCSTGPSSENYGFIGADGLECYVTPVGEGDVGSPSTLYLGQAVANPFNPNLEISYGIPQEADSARVVLNVYDLTGERVRTLVDGVHTPGAYRVLWNGADYRGARVPDGAYFCRIVCEGKTETKKIDLTSNK
jgi:hypothetical protein